MTDEFMMFADEPAPPLGGIHHEPWNLLVVDDERGVHDVTELALKGFTFAGRGLKFLHAYSGAESKKIFENVADIALVLLDVVMETDHAGLDVVEYVRNQLGNHFVRIVLRTGQPGQAPQTEVIQRYDINDYKSKTELTRERLFTTVHTGLSTYRDLMALDANRRGLEKVIRASGKIFETRSMEQFAQGVLEQLAALLFLDQEAVLVHAGGVATDDDRLRIIAGTGEFACLIGRYAHEALPERVYEQIKKVLATGQPQFGTHFFVSGDFEENALVFYVCADEAINPASRRLIELFCENVGIAMGTLRLLEQKKI